jgi:hypothetical protein
MRMKAEARLELGKGPFDWVEVGGHEPGTMIVILAAHRLRKDLAVVFFFLTFEPVRSLDVVVRSDLLPQGETLSKMSH